MKKTIKLSAKAKREIKRLLFYSVMIAFPLAQVLIFYFGVNINSILLSFKNYDSTTGTYVWTGFEHFLGVLKEIFSDVTWKFAFKNSLLVWFVETSVTLTLSLFFSYYIYKKGFLRNFFRVTLFLPQIISSIVMVILFTYFIDSFIPMIIFKYFNKEIMGLLSNPKTTMMMLLFYSITMGFGSNVLLLSSSMSSIPQSLSEAAQIDGANKLQEFRHIVFPQIYPIFVTIFIIKLASLFSNQLNLYSFYGAQAEAQHITVGYLLYKRTLGASFAEYPDLAAIGILLTLVIVPITLLVRRILKKVGPVNE
ncbi:MAG: carbohydrate ABC transporter permease [Bacilli bacterium]